MATQGEVNNILNEFRDATFDAGYYAAVIEKTAASLSDAKLKEYARLRNEAISRRQQAHEKLMNLLYPPRPMF